MGTCTCGATTVGSNFHSSWCDTNSSDIWDSIRAKADSDKTVFVVTLGTPRFMFNKVKELYDSLTMSTMESSSSCSLRFYNGAEIRFFSLVSKDSLRGQNADFIFLEVYKDEEPATEVIACSRGRYALFDASTGKCK